MVAFLTKNDTDTNARNYFDQTPCDVNIQESKMRKFKVQSLNESQSNLLFFLDHEAIRRHDDFTVSFSFK